MVYCGLEVPLPWILRTQYSNIRSCFFFVTMNSWSNKTCDSLVLFHVYYKSLKLILPTTTEEDEEDGVAFMRKRRK